jgi:hypothetical protein
MAIAWGFPDGVRRIIRKIALRAFLRLSRLDPHQGDEMALGV